MLPLGTLAPDFDLPNVDGTMVSYAAAAGPRGTVVMFICNHCPFVKHVADQLAALGREFMPRGVGFVAISANDVSTHPADSPEQMVAEAEATRAQVQKTLADIDLLVAKTVSTKVEAAYAALQAGGVATSTPHIAPAGDEILRSSGWKDATPDPSIAQLAGPPVQPGEMVEQPPMGQDPAAAVPDQATPEMADAGVDPQTGMVGRRAGIETAGIEG
jgi:peroxiredoxin